MARYAGKLKLFFNTNNMEAYRVSGETRIRLRNYTQAYLGEAVTIYRNLDIEGIRLKRALRLIENSGGPFLKKSKDKGALQRLKKVLQEVLRYDAEHYYPGNRSIHNGLLDARGRGLLKGFDFNRYSAPGEVLGDDFTFRLEDGSLLLPDFSPERMLAASPNVSRFTVRLLISRVDFKDGNYFTYMSEKLVFSSLDSTADVRLNVGHSPKGKGFVFVYLRICFRRDDKVALPKLLWRVDDVFRLLYCGDRKEKK